MKPYGRISHFDLGKPGVSANAGFEKSMHDLRVDNAQKVVTGRDGVMYA